MTASDYVHVGIDLSTTSVRCVALDSNLRALASSAARHDDLGTRAFQDSGDWIKALQSAFDATLQQAGRSPRSVQSIGLATQGVTALAVDAEGVAVRPPMSWSSTAPEPTPDGLDLEEWQERSGRRLLPPFLAWRLMVDPPLNSGERWALAGDYLGYHLTGQWSVGPCLASTTGLIDPQTRDWSDELLERTGVSKAQLSTVKVPIHSPAPARGGLARHLGIRPSATVSHATQDQRAAVLVADPDGQACTIAVGSAGAVVSETQDLSDRPAHIPVTPALNPATWNYEGVVLAAGLALDWGARIMGSTTIHEFLEAANSIAPGTSHVRFEGGLNGTGSPEWDAYSTGSIINLTLATEPAHIGRAVVDWLSGELAKNVETLADPSSTIRLVGKVANHPAVSQSIAASIDRPVEVVGTMEPTVIGAALIGATAAGHFATLSTAFNALAEPPRTSVVPVPASRE